MKAAVYDEFRSPISLTEVADPTPAADGVVLEVKAAGVCRSDWHGWMGHDPDIPTPNVPGHEMAGVIAAVGKDVKTFAVGDRVTLPFVCACGACPQCRKGEQQVCDRQSQPGFTHWGCFAELVAIRHADHNLVRLPPSLGFAEAASLGCRFATAYRAVVAQGRISEGEWLAVFGCGGVGLAAVMIGVAHGARVIAVDVRCEPLQRATELGAQHCLDASHDVLTAVHDITHGGVDVSVDALGSAATFSNSVRSLAKRGRHVQVGLMTGEDASCPVPLDDFIARELELKGSHGMQAHRYPEMLELVISGRLNLALLEGPRLTLGEAAQLLGDEELSLPTGVSVIDRFTD